MPAVLLMSVLWVYRSDVARGTFNDDALVTPVQPYQARKAYVCPGCDSWIEPGVGHVVVVPAEAPDLRRHWHRGCWFKERRRAGSPDER